MATADTARRLALDLPESLEQPHHGFPSYRVAKAIFATQPDRDHLHIMLEPDAIREVVAAAPEACEEKYWGATLSAVRVTLPQIDDDALADLLRAAWARRAPKRLTRD